MKMMMVTMKVMKMNINNRKGIPLSGSQMMRQRCRGLRGPELDLFFKVTRSSTKKFLPVMQRNVFITNIIHLSFLKSL